MKIASFGNVCWYSTFPCKNKKLVLSKKYSENNYEKYENYNAINVNKITDIPYDYDGIMGVPISILEKYIVDEYEIIWQASGNTIANCPREVLKELGYVPHKDDKGGA